MHISKKEAILCSNYVKLAGFRSVTQQRKWDIIHNMTSFDAGTHERVDRYFSTHADIFMNMKMSNMWFKLMFVKENDGTL